MSDIKTCRDEIQRLVHAHQSEYYLSVLILAPQLLVIIIEKIAYAEEELFGSDYYEDHLSDAEKEVFLMVGKLERDGNVKCCIANGLASYYEGGNWGENGLKQFKKYFTKLEDMIALRNTLCHKFYTNEASARRIKNCSQGALDLLILFASHEYLENEPMASD